MPQCKEGKFLSSDDCTELYYREYIPDGEVIGVVQLVHGIAEHIARYDDFARFLASNGYAVAGHDHLGHGKSAIGPELLGFFSKENGWGKATEDIERLRMIMREKYPDKPYFLFGHSMGSFLSRTYIIRYPTTLDGVLLSGTGQQSAVLVNGGKQMSALECRRRGYTYKSPILNKLAFGNYNDSFPEAKTVSDWISRDPEVVRRYQEDPLCGYIPCAGLMYDMMCGIEYITTAKNVEKMRKSLPVFFLAGSNDPVGERGKGVMRAYMSFIRAGMQDVTLKLYAEDRHEILNELNKEQVYGDILIWITEKRRACRT